MTAPQQATTSPPGRSGSGLHLIAFPYHDWRKGEHESFRTRDGQLLQEFGRDPDVRQMLVVDRPVSLAERLAGRRAPEVEGSVEAKLQMRPGWSATITRVRPRTSVLDVRVPAVLAPIRDPRGWWFDIFEDRRIHEALDWGIRTLGLELASVLAWTPAVAGAIEHLRPSTFVFDSLDNWLTHPVLRRHATRATAAYQRILPSASVVFVPSEASRRELASFTPSVTVLPNGVDLARFAAPGARPHDLPDPPLVGYVGKLGVRLDAALVRATAMALPDVAFVFVGPVLEGRALRAMRGIPNVLFLGDRRVDTVPAYLASFDIAWIPHRVGEGETGGDLMKKYEYWAAGRQVVATPVADLDRWQNQIHIVRSADDAVTTIRGLLEGRITPTPTHVPPDRTWPAIARTLLDAAGRRPLAETSFGRGGDSRALS